MSAALGINLHAENQCRERADVIDRTACRAARVPTMQRILDNPFLLLFLGVTLPAVLYVIWGVMEVASIPLAK